jgi:hypothetical protein
MRAPAPKHESFWPAHLSSHEDQQRTFPDLAFDAVEGDAESERLLVLVEVKPGFLGHDFEQISREIIDAHTYTGRARIAMIMVGADRDRPTATLDWDQHLQQRIAERALAGLEATIHYSSRAALGDAIATSGDRAPDWARYSADVLDHLRRKQLLSYEGAPRRVPLLTEIRDNPRLEGLVDIAGRASPQMGRDTFSTVLTQPVYGFTTTTLICALHRVDWPAGAGVFVCFDLVHEDGPQLVVGAHHYQRTVPADRSPPRKLGPSSTRSRSAA